VLIYVTSANGLKQIINRFCCGYRPVEINRAADGAFSLRSDAPARRRPALGHKTP
jgi:hypothetical protein